MRAKAGLHSRLALFIRAGRSCSAVPENDAPLTFLCNTFIFFYLFICSFSFSFVFYISFFFVYRLMKRRKGEESHAVGKDDFIISSIDNPVNF